MAMQKIQQTILRQVSRNEQRKGDKDEGFGSSSVCHVANCLIRPLRNQRIVSRCQHSASAFLCSSTPNVNVSPVPRRSDGMACDLVFVILGRSA